MTYTKAEPIKRYCKSKQVMCEFATELGYCRITACANPSSFPETYTNTTINYKGGDDEMTREEAIQRFQRMKKILAIPNSEAERTEEAIDMAIEALQFAKHFDLLKEFQSLQEVVRCKDCKHRDEKCGMGEHRWCRILKMSTVPNDFCSYGERKGGDTE